MDHLIKLAAHVAAGLRPPGGLYTVTIDDGPRFVINREYEIYVSLYEIAETGEQRELLRGHKVLAKEWQTLLWEACQL
jgi:hypothetical protein